MAVLQRHGPREAKSLRNSRDTGKKKKRKRRVGGVKIALVFASIRSLSEIRTKPEEKNLPRGCGSRDCPQHMIPAFLVASKLFSLGKNGQQVGETLAASPKLWNSLPYTGTSMLEGRFPQ